MGRGRKGGRGGKSRGPRTDPTVPAPADGPGRTDLIEKLDMHNERFTRYYRKQSLFADEKEFEEMLDAMRRHLPTTFRVAGSRQTAHSLNKTITDVHVPGLSDIVFEDEKLPPPVQLPWYPDGLAWQFNVPKKVLRRQPEFKKFHSFLVFETEVGNISRQEAVSMIPPLFLDVEPHHKVMDMCAAPGSKTAQILEALHSQDTLTSSSIPSGLLVANDSDNKRTHLLIHQSARLPSPALMVTNLDASNYPIIRVPASLNTKDHASVQELPQSDKLEPLMFDRILCDVPCSGDGTMRKNIGIWKSWQPMDGNGLHSLQVRILQRAMRMLTKDGTGRIVYSTCSLNPVENEAVICAALNSNPAFELVDVSDKFPSLQRRPGLKTWNTSTDRTAKTFFETWEDLMTSSLDDPTKARFSKTQWAPENIEELHIERCMRIYPHLQDTGGFFVAVLERKKKSAKSKPQRKREHAETDELPDSKRPRIEESDDTIDEEPSIEPASTVEEEEVSSEPISAIDETGPEPPVSAIEEEAPEDDLGSPSEAMDTGDAEASAPAVASSSKGEKGDGTFKENPYIYLPQDHPLLQACLARLKMIPSFPSHNVLVRNVESVHTPIRSFYLSNTLVKAVITHNDYQKFRLTAAGTKVFTKQEAGKGLDAQYRVLGEGLPVVLPFVEPGAILTGSLSALRTFLESYYPLVATFEEKFREQIDESSTGSLIVRFPPEESDGVVLTHDLVLPIWKSNVSLSLMIDKKAKSALSLRLFGKDLLEGVKPPGNKQEVLDQD
ncbi:hypothetical protein EST38_g9789 [Candolleomyces aberdarensis]|uniref:SAM-dependent MTase RsmB/NOP-type domain-containing protein n=1 Tax=Candolleomyces aberdarensis TaxID=2316362 RepID=A0A4Q2D9R6_9AGAR|nr:hypothetical protein EST38_g9789 [Candolleomyces aberdarensis]